MTKIVSSANCGNSPKMEFIKQFNIAFAKGDVAFLTENVTEDIVWIMIGDQKIEGIKAFTAEWNYDNRKRQSICFFRFLCLSKCKGRKNKSNNVILY